MDKYFLLQMKRVFRVLPFALVTAILLFCGATVASKGIYQSSASDEYSKVQVAIVGDPEDSLLQMAITAIQSFDSSRFAIEIHQMTEAEAIRALEQGRIGAYVVIPDGFSQAALQGRVIPLELVSAPNSVGLINLFKEEITEVISQIVLACQKGMGGIEETLTQVQQKDEIGPYMQSVSRTYVELLLVRSKAYYIEEITDSGALSLENYLLCGFSILLFAFLVIPFAPLYIKKDLALERILIGKNYSIIMQALSEFAAFFFGNMIVIWIALVFSVIGNRLFDTSVLLLSDSFSWQNGVSILPVFLLLTAFSYMLCSLGRNVISGMLINCFCTTAFCFAGGCLYPLYYFPDSIQMIARYLPHSLAREYMAGSIAGSVSTITILCMTGYTILFLLVACLSRHCRLTKQEG